MREPITQIHPKYVTADHCPSDLRTVGNCPNFIEYLKSKIRKDMEEAVRENLMSSSTREHLAGRVDVLQEVLADIEQSLKVNK